MVQSVYQPKQHKGQTTMSVTIKDFAYMFTEAQRKSFFDALRQAKYMNKPVLLDTGKRSYIYEVVFTGDVWFIAKITSNTKGNITFRLTL